MGKTVRVHPGSGKAGDKITITLEYDKTQGDKVPGVLHVLFYDLAEAQGVNVTNRNPQARELTIDATVPPNAQTGKIEVDLEGIKAPISTVEDFKVKAPDNQPFRVTGILPPMPTEGYSRGKYITINTSRDQFRDHEGPKVFFPRTNMGPPMIRVLPGKLRKFERPAAVRVEIPQATTTGVGRVKIQDGSESVLTRILSFTEEQ
jgi:hypothetical protein